MSAPHAPAAVLRLGMRQVGRRCLNPALPWPVQRTRLDQACRATPLPRGTTITRQDVGGVRAEIVTSALPPPGGAGGIGPSGSGVSPGSAVSPLDSTARRTVVHFHGGGYCVGSALTARAWAAHLSALARCRVVLPEYRLAPEHPYPAGLEDARAVIKALLAEAEPSSLVVSGDSAGGGLALALLLRMRDEGQELPGGCVLLSGWLDLARDRRDDLARRDVVLTPGWLDACARAYADPSAWPDPLVSPLGAAHGGLPPLLIQAGGRELLAPDSGLLAASASAAGTDVTYSRWPRLWHDFQLQAGLSAAADSALAQVAWFVSR